MNKEESTTEMLLVTDREGRIVGAAFPTGEATSERSTALIPLQGQQLHRMEVPAVLATLRGHDLQMVLSQAKMEPTTSRLTLPDIKIIHRDR
jgi:hypothetical protein